MAGIYLHIPFCRRACHYCDFHFSTNLRQMDALVAALLAELTLRKWELEGQRVSTIYFGGGTPSLLSTTALMSILEVIHRDFVVDEDAEVTLEANPEDLSREKLLQLQGAGVNRLSLGTQSFLDHELKWMNRMHTAQQAIRSIDIAQEVGFDNISIDLIFGVPQQTSEQWKWNLKTAMALGVQHISSYGLTVEERTKLHHSISQGKEQHPDEQLAEVCFRMNMEVLPPAGFAHYEISNFAREGFISRHNSAYWQGAHYLGIGPSAHSFDGGSRSWNIRSNAGYIRAMKEGMPISEREVLTDQDRINEHIMTGLRCQWGVKKDVLEHIIPGTWESMLATVGELGPEFFDRNEERLCLTDAGKLMADRLAAGLFV